VRRVRVAFSFFLLPCVAFFTLKRKQAPLARLARTGTLRATPPRKHPIAFYGAFRSAPVGPASGAVAAISVPRGGAYKSQNMLLALSVSSTPSWRACRWEALPEWTRQSD